jgi:hypothetical protein
MEQARTQARLQAIPSPTDDDHRLAAQVMATYRKMVERADAHAYTGRSLLSEESGGVRIDEAMLVGAVVGTGALFRHPDRESTAPSAPRARCG